MSHALRYRKKFCKMLIDHMAKGYSYSTFGGEIGVSIQALYDWEAKYPEWKEAKAIGKAKGQKLFETLLIAKSSGKKIQNSDYGIDIGAVTFTLKTRFHKDYSEKVSHNVEVNPEANKLKVEFVKP